MSILSSQRPKCESECEYVLDLLLRHGAATFDPDFDAMFETRRFVFMQYVKRLLLHIMLE